MNQPNGVQQKNYCSMRIYNLTLLKITMYLAGGKIRMCIKKLNWVDFDFMLILMLVGINTSTVLLKRNTATDIWGLNRHSLNGWINANAISIFTVFFCTVFSQNNEFVCVSFAIHQTYCGHEHLVFTVSAVLRSVSPRLVFCSGLRSRLLLSSASKMSYWILHKNKTVLILRAAEVSSVLSAFGDEKRIDKESELKREKMVFCQCSRW